MARNQPTAKNTAARIARALLMNCRLVFNRRHIEAGASIAVQKLELLFTVAAAPSAYTSCKNYHHHHQ